STTTISSRGTKGLSGVGPGVSFDIELIQYLLSVDAHRTVWPLPWCKTVTGKSTSHLPGPEAEMVMTLFLGSWLGGRKWRPITKATAIPTMPSSPNPSCRALIGFAPGCKLAFGRKQYRGYQWLSTEIAEALLHINE